MKEYQVIAIPSEEESLYSRLGISNERMEQLVCIIEEANASDMDNADKLEYVSEKAKNQNEAAYMIFGLGIKKKREKEKESPIQGFSLPLPPNAPPLEDIMKIIKKIIEDDDDQD